MSEMITLIFEGIEGLIFDLPACTAASHEFISVAFCYCEINNPTEMLHFCGRDFPVFQKIDQHILI